MRHMYVMQLISKIMLLFECDLHKMCGPGRVVGIATDYGLDGPGIESRWERVPWS